MELYTWIRYFFIQLKSTFLHHLSLILSTFFALAHFYFINTANTSINYKTPTLFAIISAKY